MMDSIVAPSAINVQRAAHILREGGLVGFPTETVYGLGSDATNDKAVATVFETKGRPRFNPLIVHVRTFSAAEKVAEFTPLARALAERFWPGALTLVLSRRVQSKLSLLVSAGLDTVAIRMPSHPVAQALLEASGILIAAPSANRSGHVSPTTAQHVADDFGHKLPLVLDGGPTAAGLESTVIGLGSGRPRLLRPGAIPRQMIEEIAGPLVTPQSRRISSPGQLESHYAPRALLRLNAQKVQPGDALLAFGMDLLPGAAIVRNLSPTGDLKEAAANLFAMLRELDGSGAPQIAVMPIPDEGLGEAINDRLRRAAARRDSP
ncbi:MAG: threonylcarbamoyl-AMP synthase [Alphaproteobacteria bacterium]|nr:threonylcarbamoyl-AMP synthase [Alphaproteobacteria bacterium]